MEGQILLDASKRGEAAAFAKLLTWLERSGAKRALTVGELWRPAKPAYRVGITGPPGAGKSTIVGGLIKELRAKNLKVGVMAVDPSSPFTRGAILGDRLRYSEHFLDPGVFIRSLGTRGSLGGLSSAAFLMARAFDAAEFDVLLIETVGVGQTELDVLHVADTVTVVLVPESGDSIQAMKAGLMEIADLFVVNKSDRPGADGLAREIENALHDGESRKASVVLKTTANEARGLDELTRHILEGRQSGDWATKRNLPARVREEAKAFMRLEWEAGVEERLKDLNGINDLARFLK